MDIIKVRDKETGQWVGIPALAGPKGDKGDTGPQGPRGEQGPQGEIGPQGPAGSDGKDGISITHEWVGTTLSVTSASGTSSADLKGEKGEQGIQGIQGPAGADGAQGPKGDKGDPGEQGPHGIQGEKGEKGDKGDKGDTGPQGPAGADGHTPVKGTDYFTDTDKQEIATVASKLVTPESIGAAPVSHVNDTDIHVTADQKTTWDAKATTTYVDQKISEIPTPDVSGQIGEHNTNTEAHNDIRNLITGLTNRLNALADSDDTTLDQLSEIVAYIKNNKTLIDGITTSKVNVTDIINNLTTNVTNKPLSAAQGVALKALIDAITVPTKVSELENDSGYLTSYTETDPTVPAWAKAETKPTYTANEVGARPNTWTPSASDVGAIPESEKGTAGGVATLGTDALLAAAQRPKAGGLYRDDGNTTLEKSLTDISTTLQNKAATPKSVSVTLASASWDSSALTQTVTVTGVLADETSQLIIPTPALASQAAYYESGILCTGQAADSLTFTATSVPSTNIEVFIIMQGIE